MTAPKKGAHGEPWWREGVVVIRNAVSSPNHLLSPGHADRAIACVNAMDGLRELTPGAIRRLVEAAAYAVENLAPIGLVTPTYVSTAFDALVSALADIEVSDD